MSNNIKEKTTFENLDNGTIKYTNTTQKVMQKEELVNRLTNIMYEKNNLIRQSQELKRRFDHLSSEESQIKELLDGNTDIVVLGGEQ